ncbi:hypothetical protein L1987_47566 [Smallanthus sonchifolius]|uniref:Uncharacterized protein n=1 Tax=Smallanthus sonchifolius TaxID=185202 RepID=A0ACB9G2K3_9ASTR|nr:hypothetical protein L1987_47566 [Smallanthus sonchifolius]
MSAIVCGKRSFFEELSTSPASASPPVAKKIRCSSTSPVRIPPFHNSPPASVLFDQLRAVFPNIDKQLLAKALEESGNDLDLAIKSLNELCLGYVDGNSGSVSLSNAGLSEKYNTVENTSVHANAPRNGAEWVELFVTEMMNATSIDDARSRAMSILESLEKSIKERSGGEAAQSLHKENMVFKEQFEVVLRENTILKRAIAIQHERQKDYNDSTREVQHLKQLLSMQQEQLRTLQVNNYALTMHLKQAQESNSIHGNKCKVSVDRCRLKEVFVLMANPTNNSEPPNVDSPMNSKRRRKKSVVWEHFTIETIDAGCTRARCMQCKKSFAYISGSKLAGTSHLKRHIALGICPVSRIKEKNGQIVPFSPLPTISVSQENILPRKRLKSTSGSRSVSFYQDRCRQDIAKMIIMHEYPLKIVESPAFLNCVKSLQREFLVLTLDVIEQDCVGLYKRERQTLLNLVSSIQGQVNLSLDMWATDQSVGYVFITGQFIDDDWKLHRMILSVVLLPFPDSESALSHAVLSCVADWNLENKLLAVTLDESFANKAVRKNLRHLLSPKNPLILSGKFLIGSCYARVLCHLAQDALGFQDSVFDIKCKKMDRYRCSLKPSTLEALVCAKDWLQNGISDHSSDFSPSISPQSVVKTEL